MSRLPDELIEAARVALERHQWQEAYDALSKADGQGFLTGAGFELLAWAAYWTAHPDETVDALERAYSAYLHEENRSAAAMMAFRMAEQHGMRMAMSPAQGWAARAERLAEEDPEWPVHGWLEWMRGLLAWFRADFEGAIARYDKALELASRTADRDLHG
ncbi:MAG: hypothetical protein M3214_05945, partial [Actinomycetota bacterium]|nr:hypothetical protein [Actinomycetota bacterium]